MHYYQFHIGDYAAHTAHLDELEDLAYRRMLDYCYLNEIGLPESVEEVARLIRMREHCKCIASVLQEYFQLHDDGTYRHTRIESEIASYRKQSEKRSEAARKRWGNTYASALQVHSKCNANQEPITKNHKPLNNKTTTRPSVDDVAEYVETRDIKINPQAFIDYYTANGWKVGRNSMKDWKAAVRTWEKNEHGKQTTRGTSLRDDLTDTSWAG